MPGLARPGSRMFGTKNDAIGWLRLIRKGNDEEKCAYRKREKRII